MATQTRFAGLAAARRKRGIDLALGVGIELGDFLERRAVLGGSNARAAADDSQ